MEITVRIGSFLERSIVLKTKLIILHIITLQELNLFFGQSSPGVSASFRDSTLAIIKPHAVNSGQIGPIMTAIEKEGFQISSFRMFRLEKANAEEFYEIYKGVVNEYSVRFNNATLCIFLSEQIKLMTGSLIELFLLIHGTFYKEILPNRQNCKKKQCEGVYFWLYRIAY